VGIEAANPHSCDPADHSNFKCCSKSLRESFDDGGDSHGDLSLELHACWPWAHSAEEQWLATEQTYILSGEAETLEAAPD
jgi:hypothetical protein